MNLACGYIFQRSSLLENRKTGSHQCFTSNNLNSYRLQIWALVHQLVSFLFDAFFDPTSDTMATRDRSDETDQFFLFENVSKLCVFRGHEGNISLQTAGQCRRTCSTVFLLCCSRSGPQKKLQKLRRREKCFLLSLRPTSVHLQRLIIQCHQLQAGNELCASAWDIFQEKNGRTGQKHRWKLWGKPPWEHMFRK